MKKFILLIHHHAVVYQDINGNIHISSFIGRWVNALADHIAEIRLLLYESDVRLPQQDEIINKPNVTLWSLGPAGHIWDRIPRMQRLRQVCRRASRDANGLLIRGVTPRQMSVWNYVNVERKAFLLVGSLLNTQSSLKPTIWGVYEAFMQKWRKFEVLKIAEQGVLIANSPDLIDELAMLGSSAVFVPTNSISLNEFIPFNVHGLSSPRKILFCGRVIPEKGIKELIQALAEISHSQHCILDIVGPVSKSFRYDLDRLTNELGVTENIQWHGRIPYGKDLMMFYEKADVFILPTYNEGFPHVLWEAAANCCPVITTQVGGIPKLWKDGEHGILIPPKNSKKIVQTLEILFADNAFRSRLIENAYNLSKRFVVEECAFHLIKVLQKHKWDL